MSSFDGPFKHQFYQRSMQAYEPPSAGRRDMPRNAGDSNPPKPTRIQASAEKAITVVAGTNASRIPPTAKPRGNPPVSKVERAPNTRPSCSLGTLRCNNVVSIGVYGPHIKPPSKSKPQANQSLLVKAIGNRLAPHRSAINGKATPKRKRRLSVALLSVPISAPTAKADQS